MKRKHEPDEDVFSDDASSEDNYSEDASSEDNSSEDTSSKDDQLWVFDLILMTKETELSKYIIRNLLEILANKPNDATVYYQLGLELSQIVSDKPVRTSFIAGYGFSLLRDAAVSYLRHAILLKPDYIDAYRVLNQFDTLTARESSMWVLHLLSKNKIKLYRCGCR